MDLALLDQERCEFVGGQWIEKPMGTPEHSKIARRLEAELRKRYLHLGEIEREVTFRLGDDLLIPDIALYSGSTEQPPVLCLEVQSPGQRRSRLFAECELFHKKGVPYCWVVELDGTAWEYHHGGLPTQRAEVLEAGEVRLPVSAALAD